MSRKKEKISQIHPDFQDEFFISLDRILIPIGGKEFEKTAMDVAFYIAHEYGAKLDLLHVGKDPGTIIDNYLNKLNKYGIDHDLILIRHKSVSRAIIDHWKKNRYELVVMAARRKPTFIDKLVIHSVSNTVIKNIQSEVLQVFPPKLSKLSTKLKNVAVLLPYSSRDPFLIRWASAIAAPQKNANINIFHFCIVPEVVPLEGAKNEQEIKNEEEDFKDYIQQYSEIFGHILKSKIIIGHDVFASLEYITEKDEPDVVIIGRTKPHSFWDFFVRPLSSKIRDKLLNPSVIIHHMR
ncbi:MAG: universal stress protein [Candidatus Heimdallarchaeaceae archaeon]